MPNSPIRGSRYWQLLFTFTAAVMIINVMVAIYSLEKVRAAYEASDRALQIMMSIRTTYSAIQDVEISERDYLLWGNEDALQVYRDSVADVVEGLKTVHSIDSEVHTLVQVNRFETLLFRRLRIESVDELEFPYAGTPPPVVNWDVVENAELMHSIHEAVNAISDSHAELLATRRMALLTDDRWISIALILVTALSFIGMALMYRVLHRALLQQQRWQTHMLEQNQVLEDTVAERTAALQQNSRELERSNRELEEFAFVASHDLQEPLRKIQAFGDRLKARSADTLGENVDYLNRMQSAATRMSMLIHDLLEFSRVTAKPRTQEVVALDDVLANVLEDLEEAIHSSGTVLQIDPLPKIAADSTQMHQLFQNLIGNAIKFVAKDRAPRVRITAKLIDAPAHPEETFDTELLEIHVIDNGIGFEQEYADRIFKPFQRLHSREEYSGTGIGLALCRRIVERHNGTLDVSSKRGEGTDFIIILPLHHTSIDIEPPVEGDSPDLPDKEPDPDA